MPKNYYEIYKSLGLCTKCGDRRDGSGATALLCSGCAAYYRAWKKRKKLQDLAAKGLSYCSTCRAEYPKEMVTCAACEERKRRSHLRAEEGRRLWAKLGWCRKCGDPQRVLNTFFCHRCQATGS